MWRRCRRLNRRSHRRVLSQADLTANKMCLLGREKASEPRNKNKRETVKKQGAGTKGHLKTEHQNDKTKLRFLGDKNRKHQRKQPALNRMVEKNWLESSPCQSLRVNQGRLQRRWHLPHVHRVVHGVVAPVVVAMRAILGSSGWKQACYLLKGALSKSTSKWPTPQC